MVLKCSVRSSPVWWRLILKAVLGDIVVAELPLQGTIIFFALEIKKRKIIENI
jgi:hypothetical protein